MTTACCISLRKSSPRWREWRQLKRKGKFIQIGVQMWTPATRSRYQAAFSLIFRVAVDNGKIDTNPASRINRKAEDNEILRYLTDGSRTLPGTATVTLSLLG